MAGVVIVIVIRFRRILRYLSLVHRLSQFRDTVVDYLLGSVDGVTGHAEGFAHLVAGVANTPGEFFGSVLPARGSASMLLLPLLRLPVVHLPGSLGTHRSLGSRQVPTVKIHDLVPEGFAVRRKADDAGDRPRKEAKRTAVPRVGKGSQL